MKEIMVAPEKYLDEIKKRACTEYLADRISAEVLTEVIGVSIEIYEDIQKEKIGEEVIKVNDIIKTIKRHVKYLSEVNIESSDYKASIRIIKGMLECLVILADMTYNDVVELTGIKDLYKFLI